MNGTRPLASWLKTFIVVEALFCFAPAAIVLTIGALLIPIQIVALRVEPLHTEGPAIVISSVLSGLIALAALGYVIGSLLRDRPLRRPILIFAAGLLGCAALWPFLFSNTMVITVCAALAMLGTAHILFVSRHHMIWRAEPPERAARHALAHWPLIVMAAVALGLNGAKTSALSHKDLLARRAAWIATKPRIYSYELWVNGFSAPREAGWPRRIVVQQDRVVSARYVIESTPASAPPAEPFTWTIDTTFDQLLAAQDHGLRVRSRFDRKWGYVTHASLESDDPDQVWELEIKNFQASPDESH